MEITTIYAICLSSFFVLALVFAHAPVHAGWNRLVRYLKLGTVIPRFIFGESLALSTALQYLIYVTINLCCLLLNISIRQPRRLSLTSLEATISRAGYLLLANLMPLYISPHFSSISHALKVSLSSIKNMHYTCGLISCGLFALHSYSYVAKTSFSLEASNIYKLMVSQPFLPPLSLIIFSFHPMTDHSPSL